VTLPPHPDLVTWLGERLGRPLPGPEAHARMAPFPARTDPAMISVEGKAGRQAAVLVLIYPLDEGGTPALVLTARQPSLRDHSGQVSLPGGSLDPGETPEQAALREGHEEVGVPPGAPRLVGRLTPIFVPPSKFSVYPVVAALDARPVFTVHEAEVAALIEVPLARLLDGAFRRTAPRTIFGRTYDVPVFDLDGFEVWGATAMMLSELAAVLEEATG